MFRTASGAGFDRIYLAGYTGAPPDTRISKVALGAEDEVPFTRCQDLDALLLELRDHYIVVLEQHPRSLTYSDVRPPSGRPVTLVVGEELFGMPGELIERADAIAEIPMAGYKESLNVASAFAVVAYDLAAKLGKVGTGDLKSRHPPASPRPGVLTRGPTVGEAPGTG